MSNPSKKGKQEKPKETAVPPMPFNEALKRVWSAPPKHKTKKPNRRTKP